MGKDNRGGRQLEGEGCRQGEVGRGNRGGQQMVGEGCRQGEVGRVNSQDSSA